MGVNFKKRLPDRKGKVRWKGTKAVGKSVPKFVILVSLNLRFVSGKESIFSQGKLPKWQKL